MFSAETIEQARALAQRDDREREDLEQFIYRIEHLVANPFISHDGQVLSLGQYLDACERHGSAGDEQSVVDELTRGLLRALGYQPGDFSYNLPLGQGPQDGRPDFTVRVPEFLGSTPLFIIEDKSTSIRDLGKQIDGESPRGQLRRYVQSGKVHGRVGLLVNGWRIEGWEFGGDGDVRVVDVDLHEVSRSKVTDTIHRHLQVLHSRFSRGAFGMADNTAALLRRPKLNRDLIQQLNDGPLRQNDAAGLTALLESYLEELWRKHAIDVSRSPESLVDALRGLIELCVDDAVQQLDDAILRYSVYLKATNEYERQANLDDSLARIRLYRPHFELTPDEYDGLCLAPLRDWAKRPSSTAQHLHDEVMGGLDPHWKSGSGTRKKTAKALQSEIMAFTRSANACFLGREQLESEYRLAVRTVHAYQVWRPRVSSSVLVGKTEDIYRAEFARQTAYVYIIRLLLVRICEDKRLFKRKLSDGGLALWLENSERYLDYASGRSYDYLTRMAYDCASNVYLHFYGSAGLFDWYRMDDKTLLRALAVLNAFNLEQIDTDIIGAVYGRYLIEGKHEQGRYYTPESVVETMLDMCGYAGANVLDRRLLDPACGSGSFLVAACRRIIDRFRGPDGEIPVTSLRSAVEEVQRSLFGLDLNPFACYLAETNLLIQVLDLIRVAQREGMYLAINRFHVYGVDSLLVDEELGAADAMPTLLLGTDRAWPERIKARVEPFREGFDYIVGNPPYVRADEEAEHYLAYRRSVEQQRWFTSAHKKWDLYVPFIEQSLRLLNEGDNARACLVTIESLATAPYAEKIRERLVQQGVIHDIAFCQNMQLFPRRSVAK
ncbi:MAG: N-6 DNA methylase [Candidatus Competibacteraceae bacterium]|nr:N-6 DNA methylase [Candidatus Competibacteraceae bacterium]